MQTSFFIGNREQIARTLNGGILILTAHNQMQRSNDAAAKFEQEANFWYLTGITEPDWQLIVDGSRNKSWLVSAEYSETQQTFGGSLDEKSAINRSGVDGVISRTEANDLLRSYTRKHSIVHTLGEDPNAKYYDFIVNPAQKHLWKQLERTFSEVNDCRLELAKLRAIKQPEEIRALQKAITMTSNAFTLVKNQLPTFQYEYEIEAEFSYYFRKSGAEGHAYEPIVASGLHACTLHYGKNNDRLKKSDLVLIDIGAKVDGYPADITRTYSSSRDPSRRKRAVHEAVLCAQQEIISLLKPQVSVEEYHTKVDMIMKEAVMKLGLISSAEDPAYRRYFPHAISHGLGIDVHDSLGRPAEFLPGMVLTVEPGIYIPEEGIGVRIEDDILITNMGNKNLSGKLSTDL